MTTASIETAPSHLVSDDVFREAMGHFVSGVTVVTTRLDGIKHGATVSAFTSLSMDPPMLLVCLNRTSETGRAIEQAGEFTVNLLSDAQSDLATRFASRTSGKFEGVPLAPDSIDHPVFNDSLGWIRCRVVDTSYGGTHRIFVAEALSARIYGGEPLTYFRGGFGNFVPWERRIRSVTGA